MNTLFDILALIVETVASLFLTFVLLRFLLQLVRADFYNPMSQSIVKMTNPLLMPLRKVIPGVFGIDVASLVLALLIQIGTAELIYLIYAHTFYNLLGLILWGVLGLLNMVIYIGFGCILILVVSSFVAPFSSHPIIVLAKQIMAPIITPVQKIIPPMGGLDFSVMAVGFGMVITQKIILGIAVATGFNMLAQRLIIGL